MVEVSRSASMDTYIVGVGVILLAGYTCRPFRVSQKVSLEIDEAPFLHF